MSTPPSPWPAPNPRTLGIPARTRRDRRTTAGLVALGALGIGLLAGGTIVALRSTGGGRGAAAWDPSVAALAADVEARRGLRFEQPVEVTFLADEDFEARVRSVDVTDQQRADADDHAAVLRGLGLLEGDVDLIEESEELAASGILGFYDPGSSELVVRGHAGRVVEDPYLQATIVHELTHALQDQHFDLEALLARRTDAERSAARAFIEADATWVEAEWVGDLSPAEQAEYARAADAAGPDAAELAGVPDVLAETLAFPYVFGPALRADVHTGGLEAVDAAFGSLPTSTEQVLFPASYHEGDDPAPVEAPAARDGDDELATGVLGAFGLFQVLSARIDYAATLDAVDGWGGDAYRSVRRDGGVCVLLAVTGDDDVGTELIGTALADWADGVDSVVLGRDGEAVTVEACDPGGRLPPPRHRTETQPAFPALAVRASVIAQVRPRVDDLAAAECVGDRVVATIGVERLAALAGELEADSRPVPPTELATAVDEALTTC